MSWARRKRKKMNYTVFIEDNAVENSTHCRGLHYPETGVGDQLSSSSQSPGTEPCPLPPAPRMAAWVATHNSNKEK